MMTVADIISTVGHRKFAEALGVKQTAVSNMKSDNRIPAKKYRLVCRLCSEHGLPQPVDDLFSFDVEGAR